MEEIESFVLRKWVGVDLIGKGIYTWVVWACGEKKY